MTTVYSSCGVVTPHRGHGSDARDPPPHHSAASPTGRPWQNSQRAARQGSQRQSAGWVTLIRPHPPRSTTGKPRSSDPPDAI